MIPDVQSLTVYGIPWMIVGAVFAFLLQKYFPVSSEIKLFFTALWATAGYIFISNIQAIESLWPAMPDVLPQILTAILIFGSMLGFQPGETSGKVVAFLNTVKKRR